MRSGRLGAKHFEAVAEEIGWRTASTLKITLNFKDHLTFRFYLSVQEPMSTCPSNRGSHMLWTDIYSKRPTISLLRGGLLADLVWDMFLPIHSSWFSLIVRACMKIFSSSNTVHDFEIATPAIILNLTKKNIPAETAEHNLDSVGLFTRSMNSTNTEGLSLSRGEQGAWSPGKFLNFELPKSPVFFPAHGTWTDGGLVQDFLPYLFALVGYLFLKFSQPLPLFWG